jgi:hypothetical protein
VMSNYCSCSVLKQANNMVVSCHSGWLDCHIFLLLIH